MKRLLILFVSLVTFTAFCTAKVTKRVSKNLIDDPQEMAIAFAEDALKRFPELWMFDWGQKLSFGYPQAVGGSAYMYLFAETGNKRYFDYAEQWCDSLVQKNGEVRHRPMFYYNLDLIRGGLVIQQAYREIRKNPFLISPDTAVVYARMGKYKKAMEAELIRQLTFQPRTTDGGFWHKLIYPHQMWLDGVYMASPFMAAFGQTFKRETWQAEALQQVITCWRHTYDPKTGLLHHAWDESGNQKWCDAKGHSPNFWGRSIGWYMMALVDVLDYIPEGFQSPLGYGHKDTVMISGRDSLIGYLNHLVEVLPQYQRGGLWYQVLDQPDREGNWPEASVTAQFMYAIAKAVNKGYIPVEKRQIALDAFNGLQQTNFVHRDEDFGGPMLIRDEQGLLTLTQCCSVSGLGGNPYRDGSYEYYINEKIRHDDGKAVGPFIMGCYELGKSLKK